MSQEFTINWITALVIPLITSLIFFLFIASFRPIIAVSKYILWEKKTSNRKRSGLKVRAKAFQIKIVNWTFSHIYEVKVQLRIASYFRHDEKNKSVFFREIPLINNEFMFIPSMISPKGLRNAQYAQVFMTVKDLEKILKNITNDENFIESHIEFRLIAKHGLSGYNKVITRKYKDPCYIREGKFKYGFSLKMKKK